MRESAEAEKVRRAHAHYFMGLCETAEPHLATEQQEWGKRLDDEYDNIRAVTHWAGERGADGDEEALEVGLRTQAAIWRFSCFRSHLGEAQGELVRLLDLQRAIAQSQDGKGKSWASSNAQSATIRANALNRTGTLSYSQGNLALVRAFTEEGLALYREIGDKKSIADSLNVLGIVASQEKDYTSARIFIEESLKFRRAIDDKLGIAACFCNLGLASYGQEDYNTARSFMEQSLAQAREIGHTHLVATAFVNLGLINLQQGDYASARSNFEVSLEINWELGHSVGAVYALVGLGTVSVSAGQSERGTRLLGAADVLAEEVGMVMENEERTIYEHAIAKAHQQSGEEVFKCTWDEGRRMSGQQAFDYALGAE